MIGVPEHFNLPWHLAVDEGAFEERGINVEWEDIPEGTGRMCQMLRDNETDLAVILTEGIIKDISAGNPSKIIQVYVESPLYWGIHVSTHSPYRLLPELEGKTAAISRYGSGSHLMAYINASEEGWHHQHLKFKVVNNIEGAVEALSAGEADYFMWEHFTTKPLVDKGIFRRISDCPTPWPCFVIAASEKGLSENAGALKHVLQVLNVFTEEFKNIPSIDRMLANRYGQKLDDIREWLSITRWSQKQIAPMTVKTVQDELMRLNMIENRNPHELFVTNL